MGNAKREGELWSFGSGWLLLCPAFSRDDAQAEPKYRMSTPGSLHD